MGSSPMFSIGAVVSGLAAIWQFFYRQYSGDLSEPTAREITPAGFMRGASLTRRTSTRVRMARECSVINPYFFSLHAAARLNNPHMIREMIKLGADADAKNREGKTAIQLAAAVAPEGVTKTFNSQTVKP